MKTNTFFSVKFAVFTCRIKNKNYIKLRSYYTCLYTNKMYVTCM